MRCLWLSAAGVITACAAVSYAQSYVYVGNNGNLEGSVTSYRAELYSGLPSRWTLEVADRVVTGSRTSLSQSCPGCNTSALALAPDNAYLATTHASGSPMEQLTVYALDGAGGMQIAATLLVPDTSLDVVWYDDELIVAPMVLGSSSQLRLYRFDRGTQTISLRDSEPSGQFSTSVQVWNGRVYVNDSFGNAVRVYEVDPTPGAESLTLVQTQPMSVFGVHLLATYGQSESDFLYATSGISGGGDKIAGFEIDRTTGLLTPLPALFVSGGSSPSQLSCGGFEQLYVGHGTDATVRRFDIDRDTGALTPTADLFDVGLQGSIGGMAAGYDCAFAGLLVTDDTSSLDGLVGLYTMSPGLVPSGDTAAGPLPSGGTSPSDIAVVRPRPNAACVADVDGNMLLNFADVAIFLDLYGAQSCLVDFDGCGLVNFQDVQLFLQSYVSGCP